MLVFKYNHFFKVQKSKRGCAIDLKLNKHDSDYIKIFLTKGQIKFLYSIISNFKKEKKEK